MEVVHYDSITVIFGFGAHPRPRRRAALAAHGPTRPTATGSTSSPCPDHPYIGCASTLTRPSDSFSDARERHRRLRQRHQPADPARTDAGADGDVAVGAVGRPRRARHGRGRAVGPDLRPWECRGCHQAEAVDAFEEAIGLVMMLSGGGPPVTYQGRYYQVRRDRAGSRGRASGVDRVRRSQVPGRHRPGGRRLDPRPRGGLAQRAVPDSRPVIDDAAAAAAAIRVRSAPSSTFPDDITARPLPATRDGDGRWVGGSVEQWADELTGAVLDHGATGFTLFAPDGAPDTDTLWPAGPRTSPRPSARRSRRRTSESWRHRCSGRGDGPSASHLRRPAH